MQLALIIQDNLLSKIIYPSRRNLFSPLHICDVFELHILSVINMVAYKTKLMKT